MSQCDRTSSFMSLDYGSRSVEDDSACKLGFLVSLLGREGYVLPEFMLKMISW